MEVLGVLIEKYEDEHVPEITAVVARLTMPTPFPGMDPYLEHPDTVARCTS